MSQGQLAGETSKLWTTSNKITIVRILLVPVFVAVLLCPWPEWFGIANWFSTDDKRILAAIVFIAISCTDWLDGYLARSRNEVTTFGKFMDPLADKILVAAALIALVELGSLPTWVVLIILAREFIVSGVRMMAAAEGVVIAASYLGKFKTVFQMVAIVLFTVKDSHMIGGLGSALSDKMWLISWAVMIVALVLTIASMIDYLYKARELIGFAPKAADEAVLEADASFSSESGAAKSEPFAETAAGEADAARGDAASAAAFRAAQRIVRRASAQGLTVGTAESLTGGLIASALTSIPGSSGVVSGGIVSYMLSVKERVLGVDAGLLRRDGAVCEEVACQMATGARTVLSCDIAVAVTGIAGPGGAEPGKPVGTVWIGLATAEGVHAECFHFAGDRKDVRRQTVEQALEWMERAVDTGANARRGDGVSTVDER